MRDLRLAGILVLVAICLQSCTGGDDGAAPGKAQSSKTVKLPRLTVDIKNKTVTGSGRICLTSGILEYLLVAEGGKAYESVVEMDVKPSDLHTALLVIGAVPGEIPEEFTAEKKGDLPGTKKKEEASRFVIFVEWVEDGDDEGVHFYLTEVSVVPTTGDNRSEWQRQADEDWDYYNDDDEGE